jgi:hypothetical protein
MSTFTHATTRDGVVDRIMSISFIAALPDAERAEIRHGVMDILAGEGATDAESPVAFPYRTEVWLTSRR